MDHPLTPISTTAPADPLVIQLDGCQAPHDALARFVDLPDPTLLQSAARGHSLSRYSFLAADPVVSVTAHATEWPTVRDRIRATLASPAESAGRLPPFRGGWMGWLTYELGSAFDRVPRHANQPHPVPDIAVGLYDWVIVWDHGSDQTCLISTGVDRDGRPDPLRARQRADAVLERWHGDPPALHTDRRPAETPRPDQSAAEYRRAVERVIGCILAGDIFQANLSQRFSVPFGRDVWRLYVEMLRHSPAPMAAFLRRGDVAVASASPERFVRLDIATRQVETRPIKGTRPRDAEAARDRALADELKGSVKDRAENVMIVDLMRNDLSRVCVPGSIRTPTLCALESHPTVHHLVSTVTGDLRADCDALDLLAATFPGGSITGAPKVRAMEVIAELEPVARGIYAGSIVWIGFDGAMDTSIVIRTATVTDGVAVFHAGGGITALSVPDREYEETLDKARALVAALADAS